MPHFFESWLDCLNEQELASLLEYLVHIKADTLATTIKEMYDLD